MLTHTADGGGNLAKDPDSAEARLEAKAWKFFLFIEGSES
jgi:hypothetical protein